MITGDRALAQGKKGAFWNTISEFHKHWNRIDIITPRIPVHRYDMVMFGNVYIHPSPFPIIFQPFWIWWKGKQLAREQKHELITVHSYPPFYNDNGGWLVHKSTGIPYVLEVLHVPGIPRASNTKERVYRVLVKVFFRFWVRSAIAVRVMNKHETPEYLVRSGVSRKKIVHIPALYIDTDVFKPMDLPKKFDLIFVGRLADNKGLRLFMDVVRDTESKALVVGEGPLKKWAQEYAKKQRISVVFHGFAKDQYEVAELMNSARLLCMFSDNEGGPRVVPESLACGTPVLATPVGIIPDILPPEAIEEWSAEALADKARNILNDKALYGRLRDAGHLAVQSLERKGAIQNYAERLKGLIT